MPRTNYLQSLIDTIYENPDRWWTIEELVAAYYEMPLKRFNLMKRRADECRQFKTYISSVRRNFDEMGEVLLGPENEKGYKRATAEDREFIIRGIKRGEIKVERLKEICDRRHDNAVNRGLLPAGKDQELLQPATV